MSSTTEASTDDHAARPEIIGRAARAVDDLGVDGLVAARWSGLAGRVVDRISIRDAFPLGIEGGIVVLQATLADGATALLTLPFDEPATWAGVHDLIARGGSVGGAYGGRLEGRPSPGQASHHRQAGLDPGSLNRIRAAPGDQSHTSVIVDEACFIKLYRRLSPGLNAEAEILAALALGPVVPVPAWQGSVDMILQGGEATSIAVEQSVAADALDAFEVLADGLAAWLQRSAGVVPTTLSGDIGAATGRLHLALATTPGSAFARREATPNDRASWLRTAETSVGVAIGCVGAVDPGLARWLERAAPAIRDALHPLEANRHAVTLQRIHGDLHLGQVLPTPQGVLLIDFEGDPTRDPSDRRSVAAPLRDVASMLRSIDHVARSGLRRARAPTGNTMVTADAADAADTVDASALESWIAAARSAFLQGYAAGLGDPAWLPDPDLLRALEMEKELAEFIYAATYLPAWLYAPTGGLRALLGSGPDVGVRS